MVAMSPKSRNFAVAVTSWRHFKPLIIKKYGNKDQIATQRP